MFLVSFYQSTVGKKIIMAVTGLIWVGYLILHMAGNLQAFIGGEKFNAYSRFLHGPAGELLWIARIILVVAFVLHVMMAWQLTQRARAARPIAYQKREPQVSTLASKWMRWGGVFILLWLVFHILHFTTGHVDPAGAYGLIDGHGSHDIFGNLVASFRIWWVVLLYVVAMVFVGLHLFHGAWSSVRTLGYAKPSPNPLRRQVALVVAVVVWAGFTVIPLAVLAGFIR